MNRRRIASSALALVFLLAPTADAVTDGVIVVCPTYIILMPTQLPAGWGVDVMANQPFKDAGVSNGKIWCGYAEPNPKNAEAGVITRPVPPGTACTVNASNPRQFDCLPAPPSKFGSAATKAKVAIPR